MSKQILERTNKHVLENTNANLWKNTKVINWFQAIEDKPAYRFISFDVVEHYPSKTKELLNKALDFASQFDTIAEKERDIINEKDPACIPTSLYGESPDGQLGWRRNLRTCRRVHDIINRKETR